jgi:hypothetical protein
MEAKVMIFKVLSTILKNYSTKLRLLNDIHLEKRISIAYPDSAEYLKRQGPR